MGQGEGFKGEEDSREKERCGGNGEKRRGGNGRNLWGKRKINGETTKKERREVISTSATIRT